MELNNQQGRIQEWNAERRRFVVRMRGGHELLLKAGNLRNVMGDRKEEGQQGSPRGMPVDRDQVSNKGTTAWAIAPSDECVKTALVLIDDEACKLFGNKARTVEEDLQRLRLNCGGQMREALSRCRDRSIETKSSSQRQAPSEEQGK